MGPFSDIAVCQRIDVESRPSCHSGARVFCDLSSGAFRSFMTTLSASTVTLKENEKVSFERAEINMEQQQGILVNTATTYYAPKV